MPFRIRRLIRPVAVAIAASASVLALTTAPAAAAEPPVDPYQSYVDPGCLAFVEQPGVKEFRAMILSRIGGSNGGIFACSGYEHGEGRAWDWMMSAGNAGQAAQVQQVLDWLLRSDAAGNPHAMARRLGIGNIIWNRRSISLWTSSAKQWNNYSCDGSPGDCHTNHVHFAFSWAGARQQTTWFTTAGKPGSWYPDGVGTAGDVPVPGDYDGDGRDNLAIWRPSEGKFHINMPDNNHVYPSWGVAGDVPVSGDFNRDGRDDIGIWRPSEARFHLNINGALALYAYGAAGDVPVIGDWDGTGSDNLAVFRPSEGRWHYQHDDGSIHYASWGQPV
jgi:hypothetical protein